MKNKIKIIHITHSLEIGGAEILILDLCRKIDKSLYEPVVCSLSPGGALAEDFKKNGIQVYYTEKKEGKDVQIFYKLYRLFKKIRPDIIHSHLSYMWLYSTIPAKLAGVKGIVLTEHANLMTPSILYCFLSRVTQKITDYIVTNSKQIKYFLIEHEGLNNKNIVIIPNGLDLNAYSCSGNRIKIQEELGLSEDDSVIGFVSRLQAPKDHYTLLDAIEKMLVINKKVKLLLVGNGMEENNIKNYIESKGLTECVLMLGYRRDIPDLLSCMEIFVLSSKKEGQSIAIMEAMAMGLPVVATASGGTPELVDNEITGILVSPCDSDALARALLRLIEDKQLSNSLGNAGKQYMQERYDIDIVIKQYQELYSNILNK